MAIGLNYKASILLWPTYASGNFLTIVYYTQQKDIRIYILSLKCLSNYRQVSVGASKTLLYTIVMWWRAVSSPLSDAEMFDICPPTLPKIFMPLHRTQFQLVGSRKIHVLWSNWNFRWNGEADKSESRGRRIPADNNWEAQLPLSNWIIAASSSFFLPSGTTQYLWERSEEVCLGAFASMIAAHRSTARRLTLNRATKGAVVTAFLRCTTIRYIQDCRKHERWIGRGRLVEKGQRACYITCKSVNLGVLRAVSFLFL